MRYWIFIASGSDSYDWYLKCAGSEGCWCHRQGKGSGFKRIAAGDQVIFYVAGLKRFLAYARVVRRDERTPYSYCHSQRFLLADFRPFPSPVSLNAAGKAAGFPGTPRGSYRPVSREVFDGILQLADRQDHNAVFFFRREADLERFLLDNWGRLDFLKDYVLYKHPDGRFGHQLQLSESSRPDILCRNRVTGDFLVIELKYLAGAKDVAQVSRYLAEVDNKLADKNFSVRAMILAQSFEPDVFLSDHPRIDFVRLDISVAAVPLTREVHRAPPSAPL